MEIRKIIFQNKWLTPKDMRPQGGPHTIPIPHETPFTKPPLRGVPAIWNAAWAAWLGGKEQPLRSQVYMILTFLKLSSCFQDDVIISMNLVTGLFEGNLFEFI